MTKILLVEDDKSLREIYGVRLLAEGYDIISAGDGEAALAMAIKERPSLIVSDVMMPKISGFDMLDILRSTTETKDIKVIMMTALSSEDQRARGEALGADRYLVKSQVGIEDVVRTVHEVLGDAPVTPGAAAQAFGSTSGPRPAPSVQPQPRTAQPLASTMPAPAPFTATAAPQPRPVAMPQQPQPSNVLPQPTAPFSGGARPTNLGERVLHPISQPAGPSADLSSRMAEELQQGGTAPQVAPAPQPMPAPAPISSPLPPPPPAPTVQLSTPAPQVAPAPGPMRPVQPQPMVAPVPQPTASAQPEVHEDSGISFEETPRAPQPPAPRPGI